MHGFWDLAALALAVGTQKDLVVLGTPGCIGPNRGRIVGGQSSPSRKRVPLAVDKVVPMVSGMMVVVAKHRDGDLRRSVLLPPSRGCVGEASHTHGQRSQMMKLLERTIQRRDQRLVEIPQPVGIGYKHLLDADCAQNPRNQPDPSSLPQNTDRHIVSVKAQKHQNFQFPEDSGFCGFSLFAVFCSRYTITGMTAMIWPDTKKYLLLSVSNICFIFNNGLPYSRRKKLYKE